MSERLTPEELASIEARCDAATPGPWTQDSDYPETFVWGPNMEMVADHGDDGRLRMRGVGAGLPIAANARFVAHARTDIPLLTAEIHRLKAENRDIRELYTRVRAALNESVPKGMARGD